MPKKNRSLVKPKTKYNIDIMLELIFESIYAHMTSVSDSDDSSTPDCPEITFIYDKTLYECSSQPPSLEDNDGIKSKVLLINVSDITHSAENATSSYTLVKDEAAVRSNVQNILSKFKDQITEFTVDQTTEEVHDSDTKFKLLENIHEYEFYDHIDDDEEIYENDEFTSGALIEYKRSDFQKSIRKSKDSFRQRNGSDFENFVHAIKQFKIFEILDNISNETDVVMSYDVKSHKTTETCPENAMKNLFFTNVNAESGPKHSNYYAISNKESEIEINSTGYYQTHEAYVADKNVTSCNETKDQHELLESNIKSIDDNMKNENIYIHKIESTGTDCILTKSLDQTDVVTIPIPTIKTEIKESDRSSSILLPKLNIDPVNMAQDEAPTLNDNKVVSVNNEASIEPLKPKVSKKSNRASKSEKKQRKIDKELVAPTIELIETNQLNDKSSISNCKNIITAGFKSMEQDLRNSPTYDRINNKTISALMSENIPKNDYSVHTDEIKERLTIFDNKCSQ